MMVTLEMLLVGLPLLFAAPIRAEDVEGLRRNVEGLVAGGFPALSDKLAAIPWIGASLAERWDALQFDFSPLTSLLQPYAGVIAQQALALLLAVLSGRPSWCWPSCSPSSSTATGRAWRRGWRRWWAASPGRRRGGWCS
ncbi:hypothetical protein [Teichococcus aestuarii]|uniref:hypothetical protein n=1 Tax=Teichococcus aestuarii TaxID=568898 RepID=UPI00360EF512